MTLKITVENYMDGMFNGNNQSLLFLIHILEFVKQGPAWGASVCSYMTWSYQSCMCFERSCLNHEIIIKQQKTIVKIGWCGLPSLLLCLQIMINTPHFFYKYLSLQKQWSGIKYIKKITKTEQISHVMSTDDETNQQMLSERHWSRLICVSYINSN